jgi:hypothetical protein
LLISGKILCAVDRGKGRHAGGDAANKCVVVAFVSRKAERLLATDIRLPILVTLGLFDSCCVASAPERCRDWTFAR